MPAAVLTIDLDARLAKLEQAFTEAQKVVKNFGDEVVRNTKGARESLDKIGESVNKLGELARGVAEAFGVDLSFRGLKEAYNSVKEKTIEAQRAQAELQVTLQATGYAAGLTQKELNELAEGVSHETIFDPDEVRQAEAALLRFRSASGETFKELLKILPNVATALRVNLVDAAQVVGRVISEPGDAAIGSMRKLRDVFGTLGDAQVDQIRHFKEIGDQASATKVLIDAMAGSVEGLAKIDTTGLEGRSKRLTNAWSELQKQIGQDLFRGSPLLEHTTELLEQFTSKTEKAQKANEELGKSVQKWGGRIFGLATGIDPIVIDKLLRLAGVFPKTLPDGGQPIPKVDFSDTSEKLKAKAGEVAGNEAIINNAIYKLDKDLALKRAANSAVFYQDELQKQQAFLAIQQSQLEFSNTRGEVSLRNYFNKQHELAQAGADAQIAVLTKQIGDQNVIINDVKRFTPDDREVARQRVVQLQNDIAKVTNDLKKKNNDITQQEIIANEQLIDQYTEIAAKLKETSGNTATGAANAFEISNRVLRRRLDSTIATGSPDQAAAARAIKEQLNLLGDQVRVQAELNDKEKEHQRTLDTLSITTDRINIQQSLGQITEIEALSRTSDAIQEKTARLKQEADAYEAIAHASNDPGALIKAEQLRVKIEQLAVDADQLNKKFRDVFVDSFSNAVTDFVTGTKTMRDAIKDLAKDLDRQLSSIAAKNLGETLFGKEGSLGSIPDFFAKVFSGKGTLLGGGGSGDTKKDETGFEALIAKLSGAGGDTSKDTTGFESLISKLAGTDAPLTAMSGAATATVSPLTLLAANAGTAASALATISTSSAASEATSGATGGVNALSGLPKDVQDAARAADAAGKPVRIVTGGPNALDGLPDSTQAAARVADAQGIPVRIVTGGPNALGGLPDSTQDAARAADAQGIPVRIVQQPGGGAVDTGGLGGAGTADATASLTSLSASADGVDASLVSLDSSAATVDASLVSLDASATTVDASMAALSASADAAASALSAMATQSGAEKLPGLDGGGGGLSDLFGGGGEEAASPFMSGNWLTDLFSGGYAEGGQPAVGKAALVGERGPEIFVPGVLGTVVPDTVTRAILGGDHFSGFAESAARAANTQTPVAGERGGGQQTPFVGERVVPSAITRAILGDDFAGPSIERAPAAVAAPSTRASSGAVAPSAATRAAADAVAVVAPSAVTRAATGNAALPAAAPTVTRAAISSDHAAFGERVSDVPRVDTVAAPSTVTRTILGSDTRILGSDHYYFSSGGFGDAAGNAALADVAPTTVTREVLRDRDHFSDAFAEGGQLPHAADGARRGQPAGKATVALVGEHSFAPGVGTVAPSNITRAATENAAASVAPTAVTQAILGSGSDRVAASGQPPASGPASKAADADVFVPRVLAPSTRSILNSDLSAFADRSQQPPVESAAPLPSAVTRATRAILGAPPVGAPPVGAALVGERGFDGGGQPLQDERRSAERGHPSAIARAAAVDAALAAVAPSAVTQAVLGSDHAAFGAAIGPRVGAVARAILNSDHFSGGFAEGGQPPVGKAALVGERGPEIFVPGVLGTVVPNAVTRAVLSSPHFSGGFAEGGQPAVGKAALVGERGPEIFVPGVLGTVAPSTVTRAILGSDQFGGAFAEGGDIPIGKLALVGENGPEFIRARTATSVLPKTLAKGAGRSGGTSIGEQHIHLHFPDSTNRGTANQIAAGVAQRLRTADRRYN